MGERFSEESAERQDRPGIERPFDYARDDPTYVTDKEFATPPVALEAGPGMVSRERVAHWIAAKNAEVRQEYEITRDHQPGPLAPTKEVVEYAHKNGILRGKRQFLNEAARELFALEQE